MNYAFCRSVGCAGMGDTTCRFVECFKSAKAYEKWLTENGYKIVKEGKERK